MKITQKQTGPKSVPLKQQKEILKQAQNIMSKKQAGIVYVMEFKESGENTIANGVCMAHGIARHVRSTAVIRAFEIEPSDLLHATFADVKDLQAT